MTFETFPLFYLPFQRRDVLASMEKLVFMSFKTVENGVTIIWRI